MPLFLSRVLAGILRGSFNARDSSSSPPPPSAPHPPVPPSGPTHPPAAAAAAASDASGSLSPPPTPHQHHCHRRHVHCHPGRLLCPSALPRRSRRRGHTTSRLSSSHLPKRIPQRGGGGSDAEGVLGGDSGAGDDSPDDSDGAFVYVKAPPRRLSSRWKPLRLAPSTERRAATRRPSEEEAEVKEVEFRAARHASRRGHHRSTRTSGGNMAVTSARRGIPSPSSVPSASTGALQSPSRVEPLTRQDRRAARDGSNWRLRRLREYDIGQVQEQHDETRHKTRRKLHRTVDGLPSSTRRHRHLRTDEMQHERNHQEEDRVRRSHALRPAASAPAVVCGLAAGAVVEAADAAGVALEPGVGDKNQRRRRSQHETEHDIVRERSRRNRSIRQQQGFALVLLRAAGRALESQSLARRANLRKGMEPSAAIATETSYQATRTTNVAPPSPPPLSPSFTYKPRELVRGSPVRCRERLQTAEIVAPAKCKAGSCKEASDRLPTSAPASRNCFGPTLVDRLLSPSPGSLLLRPPPLPSPPITTATTESPSSSPPPSVVRERESSAAASSSTRELRSAQKSPFSNHETSKGLSPRSSAREESSRATTPSSTIACPRLTPLSKASTKSSKSESSTSEKTCPPPSPVELPPVHLQCTPNVSPKSTKSSKSSSEISENEKLSASTSSTVEGKSSPSPVTEPENSKEVQQSSLLTVNEDSTERQSPTIGNIHMAATEPPPPPPQPPLRRGVLSSPPAKLLQLTSQTLDSGFVFCAPNSAPTGIACTGGVLERAVILDSPNTLQERKESEDPKPAISEVKGFVKNLDFPPSSGVLCRALDQSASLVDNEPVHVQSAYNYNTYAYPQYDYNNAYGYQQPQQYDYQQTYHQPYGYNRNYDYPYAEHRSYSPPKYNGDHLTYADLPVHPVIPDRSTCSEAAQFPPRPPFTEGDKIPEEPTYTVVTAFTEHEPQVESNPEAQGDPVTRAASPEDRGTPMDTDPLPPAEETPFKKIMSCEESSVTKKPTAGQRMMAADKKLMLSSFDSSEDEGTQCRVSPQDGGGDGLRTMLFGSVLRSNEDSGCSWDEITSEDPVGSDCSTNDFG